jgi:hypothetical protein
MAALDVSLTTFVDFVSKSGTRRLTCVREARSQYEEDYHPAKDYWRGLRNAIVNLHQDDRPREDLGGLLGRVPSRKVDRYTECVTGYKKFMGRRAFEWFEPPHTRWEARGLNVRVNPELGLRIDGTPTS